MMVALSSGLLQEHAAVVQPEGSPPPPELGGVVFLPSLTCVFRF